MSILICFYFIDVDTDLNFILIIISASLLGFLPFNFPKARLFLGDVGSCSLGLIIGSLLFLSAKETPIIFWSWLIFLGVYIVDSGYTLIERIYRRERFYVAHSKHGYQIASRVLKSHAKVSLIILVLNIFWLLPFGLISVLGILDPVIALSIAYLPLIILRKKLGNV
jgi:Fuc2NAc and GlcNAc transferase